jgi:crossover junction endodeoxyribonuclease RusA
MAETGLSLHLPWPPSINHYWRRVGAKTLISREGRRFREEVVAKISQRKVRAISGPVRVHILACRPDKRRRDIDNILKSLLDALGHAGVYEDDSQIWKLSVEWTRGFNGQLSTVPGGWVEITIKEM